jgi:spermidine synthase
MTKIGELDFYAAMARTLSEVFPAVAPYQSFIPCFGTPWGFIVASRAGDAGALAIDLVDRRVRERVRGELRYYDGLAHRHMFSLPRFLRRTLAECGRVVTDAEPLVV